MIIFSYMKDKKKRLTLLKKKITASIKKDEDIIMK